jgi:hypothetical protein
VAAPTETPAMPPVPETRYRWQDPPMIDDNVAQIKLKLQELGYEICTLPGESPTPFFSQQADAAVRQFQAVNGLVVDGIVGPLTWGMLFGPGPLPAPAPQAEAYTVSAPFAGSSGGTDIAAVGGQVWALTEGFGFLEVFDPDSPDLMVGMYALVSQPEDEAYQPMALAAAGARLWVAGMGPEGGLVQAYDTSTANPMEGLLQPQLAAGLRFEALTIRAVAASESRVWVAVETMQGGRVVQFDAQSGKRLADQALPQEAYALGLAYETVGARLWAPVEGPLGDYAVLPFGAGAEQAGAPLGVCGFQAAYGGEWLWVAKTGRLVGVDPANGQVGAAAELAEPLAIRALAADATRLWILDEMGMLQYITLP